MADKRLLEDGTSFRLLEDGTSFRLLEPPIAAFDAASSGNGTGTTVTVSHICSGTNRVLIVDAVIGRNPDSFTLTATYNGVAMTSLGLTHSNGSTAGFVEKFILINPDSGTHDIVVTRSAGTVDSFIVGGISFTGASQTLADYTGNFFSASGTSTVPSVAVTGTLADSIIQDGACYGQPFVSTGANQTQRWQLDVNNDTAAGNAGGSTEQGNGGTVTMSSTITDDWWAIQAVEILTFTGGGQTAPLGLITETESALSITTKKNVATGLITEAETARPVSVKKNVAAAQVTETETAQPVTTRKIVTLGQVIETESALPVTVDQGGPQFIPLGLVTETEISQAVTIKKNVLSGQVIETEIAQSITTRKIITLGQVVEAETARPIVLQRIFKLNQVIETEISQAITWRKLVKLGIVTELETALGVTLDTGADWEPILSGSGSFRDRILAGLIIQGFLAGSVDDRERARLLNKLALSGPQSKSIPDLYVLANEDDRIYRSIE